MVRFGVGFNATMMEGTYAIIASTSNRSRSVEEWILGDHKKGAFIGALVPEEDIFGGPNGTRTVSIELPLIGTHFIFPEDPDFMDIIVSEGKQGVVEYAAARAMGTYESGTYSFTHSLFRFNHIALFQ